MKKKIPGLFTALLLVVVLAVAASGYAGQRYVRNQIRIEASRAAAAQLVADHYTLNHTACAIKKIVEPQLASLDKARKDTHLSLSSRKRADATYKKTHLALIIWTTIPPDFDCSTLPKLPPTTIQVK